MFRNIFLALLVAIFAAGCASKPTAVTRTTERQMELDCALDEQGRPIMSDCKVTRGIDLPPDPCPAYSGNPEAERSCVEARKQLLACLAAADGSGLPREPCFKKDSRIAKNQPPPARARSYGYLPGGDSFRNALPPEMRGILPF